MKKFAFPLDRVLDWRRLQLRLAEAEMEKLHRERRVIEVRKTVISNERSRAQDQVLASPTVKSTELSALDTFGQYVHSERLRLDQLLAACAEKITKQGQVVVAKRRDVHLLEKLREKRLQEWTSASAKETEQLAEETFLARWKPP